MSGEGKGKKAAKAVGRATGKAAAATGKAAGRVAGKAAKAAGNKALEKAKETKTGQRIVAADNALRNGECYGCGRKMRTKGGLKGYYCSRCMRNGTALSKMQAEEKQGQ